MAKIFILNRQWFSKQAGNTLQSTKVYVSDVKVYDKVNNGYGEQYLSESIDGIRDILGIPEKLKKWQAVEWLEENGHAVVAYSHEVSKRSDLE